ncbi:hypothetical protein [Anaerotignum sp.]|uniref:hypothetical protein n=1 Tax=Anaerotignum sp. TaxID=2039241 RepID=UPI0027147903|nr:hypothetical protein [Anaerotignum sp.]
MEKKVKALVGWTVMGEKAAKLVGEKYKTAGVEISFCGKKTKDELILFGEQGNMTHVLYFLDHEKLLLVSLADEMGGFTVEVNVNDLIMP